VYSEQGVRIQETEVRIKKAPRSNSNRELILRNHNQDVYSLGSLPINNDSVEKFVYSQ
jgi:hypothetical protein